MPAKSNELLCESCVARLGMVTAASGLLLVADFYKSAWRKQREALDAVGAAFEAITTVHGELLPPMLATTLEAYNATAQQCELLKVCMDDEALGALWASALALEQVAHAARRVAEELAREGVCHG
jgi:hypothetical protein